MWVDNSKRFHCVLYQNFISKGKYSMKQNPIIPPPLPPPLPSCPGLEKNFERNSFPFSWHCSYSTHEFHVAICLYVYSTTFQMNHDLKMSLMSIKMRVLLLFSLSFNIHSVISSPNTYCWLVFSRLDTASLSLHRLPCVLFGSQTLAAGTSDFCQVKLHASNLKYSEKWTLEANKFVKCLSFPVAYKG